MADPKVADTKPVLLELEPGTHYWCACGESAQQPFCDGSHQGTEFQPLPVVMEEKKQMAICQCKRTGNAPQCDGAHKNL